MINNYPDFQKELSKYHLNKPKLAIHFEDNFSDELNGKWRLMDKAILEVIWAINSISQKETS